jgi:hypothetical protein
MSVDLSTGFYALLGAGIFAPLARVAWSKARRPRMSWPRFKMQTVRQTCQGIRVTDVALSFSGWTQRQADAANPQPKFEGTVYFVWKRKN